jgi:NO-binding membrane sensor protein with MHYT domain
MMFAWAGMAAGGFGGVLFDATLSYTLSFVLAWAAGILNLAVLGALALTRRARARQSPVCGDQLAKYTFTGRAALLADNSTDLGERTIDMTVIAHLVEHMRSAMSHLLSRYYPPST